MTYDPIPGASPNGPARVTYVIVRWRDTAPTGGWYELADLLSPRQFRSAAEAVREATRYQSEGGIVRSSQYIRELYRD
jgi:hypothetical protein